MHEIRETLSTASSIALLVHHYSVLAKLRVTLLCATRDRIHLHVVLDRMHISSRDISLPNASLAIMTI